MKGNIYNGIFRMMKEVYTLKNPPNYTDAIVLQVTDQVCIIQIII